MLIETADCRPSIACSGLLLGYFGVLLDVAHRILHGLDLLSFFVWNFEVESLFERHDEFYPVEGICSEIVDERRAWRDFAFFHAELIDDDLFHLVLNTRHANSSCIGNSTST